MQSDGDFELHSLWDNKKRETEVEPELMKLPGCLGQILQTQDIYEMLCGYTAVDL